MGHVGQPRTKLVIALRQLASVSRPRNCLQPVRARLCVQNARIPLVNAMHVGQAKASKTRDHTCECFAELGFCNPGEEPVYTRGKKCPSCWPKENKACMCFAAIGFCDKGEHVVV